MTVVISVRVPEELREDLKKYSVEYGEIARKAWQEAVQECKLKAARGAAKELGRILADVGTETNDRSIKKDRDKR
jgi:ribosome maturation protein Sdo1